ncbi:MAG: hypothetical protein KAI45_04475, partial [Melioribacteraceae bacterium]|nr:hypothetical protein [Melioribacteraceae bacterium]
VAVAAAIMGIMAVVTGSRVLLGFFDPDYQYFTALIGYNVIIGVVSVMAGILIWQRNSKALIFAYFITVAHVIVFLLLKTAFSDVISDHSVNAMTVRSIAWIMFSVIIWRYNSNLKSDLKKI